MNLIERVKNILITPKTEWLIIDSEQDTPPSLLTKYVLPLALISAAVPLVIMMIRMGGFVGINYAVVTALIAFITTVVAFYISAYIMDMLAPSFESEKNLNKSAQLVAYSNTPSYIAGLLSFIPAIGLLLSIAAWVYGIYLMYLGIGPLKKTPEDKKVIYMVVAFIINIVVYFILAAILGAVLFSALGVTAVSRGYGL